MTIIGQQFVCRRNMADCWPVVFAFLVGSIVAEVVPTEDYLHNARLDNDGNVEMFWKFNDTHITFEVNLKKTQIYDRQ